MKEVAFLVDGGFFTKRMYHELGRIPPEDTARLLIRYCQHHLGAGEELYKIFYYDCMPSPQRVFNPLYRNYVYLGESSLYKWMHALIAALRKHKEVALRLGRLADKDAGYRLTVEATERLLMGRLRLHQLQMSDLTLDIQQKGVDMKLGMDVSTLVYRATVDKIVLISGDSDFIPAVKLAKQKNMAFYMDSMWAHITDDLYKTIDGIKSFDIKKIYKDMK